MNLLNKLTIKNLKLNKKRTIVTIIGIILSVALITAVSSMYSSFIKSLINYETQEKGNFHVAFINLDSNNLSTFKNNKNVSEINLVKSLGYAQIDSKNEGKPYAYVTGFSEKSLKNLSVKLVEGRLPENPNEILIPTHLKTNGRVDLKVGESITLNIGKRVTADGYELFQSNPYNDDENISEKIIDTKPKTYKVVGIIERPATNIEAYSAPGYTFITYIDEKKLDGIISIYARYNKKSLKDIYRTSADILDIDEDLFKKIEGGYDLSLLKQDHEEIKNLDNSFGVKTNDYLIGLETNPIGNSSISGLGSVVVIVMLIIVFTSVFCIRNSFDISITERIKQYGMLRSIGATKKQIRKNVLYEASILGLIGIPLGILCGYLASYILIIISNYYLTGIFQNNLKLVFSFSVIASIVAIFLGGVTIYLSARKSAKKASLISPIESIRNSANVKINAKNIKSPKVIKKIFGEGGDISYKNLKRNKKKYRTTVISITVSVITFISLYAFMNLGFATVKEEIKVSEYSISLFARDYTKDSYNKFIETTKFDNIENYAIMRQVTIKLNNFKYSKDYLNWFDIKSPEKDNEEYITIYTLGEEQYKKYIKMLGLEYNEIKDKAILYDHNKMIKVDEDDNKTSKYMQLYSYKTGDLIQGTFDDANTLSVKTGLVADKKAYGLKDMNYPHIVVSDAYFDEFLSSSKTKYLEIIYQSSNANKLQDEIEEYLKDEINYSLNNVEENAKQMNNLLTLVGIFLYGFIIVISLIGITNIFNTITTNMELRKQEFAMLKSIGMTKYEFNRMIRLESLFIAIKSLLFGIPVGTIISYLMYYFLKDNLGVGYKIPLLAILISILAVFILISLIMKYSINKINKQNTIETIRKDNI